MKRNSERKDSGVIEYVLREGTRSTYRDLCEGGSRKDQGGNDYEKTN